MTAAGWRKEDTMELEYPLEKHFPLTQTFGITPWSVAYQPYGLAGHSGVDIGCPAGTLVLAADDGTVERTDQAAGGYGLHIILRHSWGISLYAHLEGLFAQAGTTVRRGQPIARSGSSGNSTGPHLHFAVIGDAHVHTGKRRADRANLGFRGEVHRGRGGGFGQAVAFQDGDAERVVEVAEPGPQWC